MKKKLVITGVILLIILGVAGALFYQFQNKVYYNTDYVNGNSAGNLYNGGLFCEKDGTVYFANPDDNFRLYSMDANGSNLKKLNDDSVSYINVDDHYIYYIRNSDYTDADIFSTKADALCRVSLNGKHVTILDEAPCMYASLIGNSIFYLHYDESDATTLYKVDIDGKNLKQLQNYYVFTCSSQDKYFYYNGMKSDGNVYQFDTTTGNISLFYECNAYKPIVTGQNDIYYLDVDQDNALVHTNTQYDKPITLTTDSVDCYNIYGSYIYYQRYSEDSPGLCMIKNDGTESSVIAQGDYSSIHITSYYIYFMDYKTKEFYYTPTSNPGELTPFHPGKIE